MRYLESILNALGVSKLDIEAKAKLIDNDKRIAITLIYDSKSQGRKICFPLTYGLNMNILLVHLKKYNSISNKEMIVQIICFEYDKFISLCHSGIVNYDDIAKLVKDSKAYGQAAANIIGAFT